jgi:hypothetical protein
MTLPAAAIKIILKLTKEKSKRFKIEFISKRFKNEYLNRKWLIRIIIKFDHRKRLNQFDIILKQIIVWYQKTPKRLYKYTYLDHGFTLGLDEINQMYRLKKIVG